jgi:urease accessory protein UreF
MPRQPIGERAMTDAERQARYRAARAAGAPVVRIRRPAERADRWMQHRSASRPDHRGRARRWNEAVAILTELQGQYAAWLERLPDNLRDSATAEALQAICDLDLTDLQAVIPPRGFGRD